MVQRDNTIVPISMAVLLHVALFSSMLIAVNFTRHVPITPMAIQATLVTAKSWLLSRDGGIAMAINVGLFLLILRVDLTTPWAVPGPTPLGDDATVLIGIHLFSDYLLPFELASVLLLMAMIGAIVLARRDVFSSDVITGEAADQGLIEKERTPLLLENTAGDTTLLEKV